MFFTFLTVTLIALSIADIPSFKTWREHEKLNKAAVYSLF